MPKTQDDGSHQSNCYLQTEREKTRKSDLKYAPFDLHQKNCEHCQRTFEFWCDEGLALIRAAR